MTIQITLTDDSDTNIELVQKACQIVYADYPIVADLATCQAILESRLGGTPSQLARQYNNLFGIKGSGTAGSVNLPTHEYVDGNEITVNAAFAANNTLNDSVLQHRHLMLNGTSDNHSRYRGVLAAKTLADAAHQLIVGGYATDPHYVSLILNTYQEYLA